MAFDINTFVIDEPTRAIMSNGDGSTRWYTNQVEKLSIKVDGEETQKTDAHGNVIATIPKGKSCTVSFDTPVYDINLIADANGTKKNVASSTAKMTTPCFEEFTVTADNKTALTLNHTPINGTVSVQTLTNSGSLKRVYKIGAATGDGTVTVTTATKTVNFADGDLEIGEVVLIVYEYETDSAVGFNVSANDKNVAGKLYIEVRGFDICDQSTAIYAYYRFPSALMKSSIQTDIELDATYPFEFDCAVEYCEVKKNFYNFVVPGFEEEVGD